MTIRKLIKYRQHTFGFFKSPNLKILFNCILMFSTIIVCAQNDFIPIDRKYEEKEVTAPLAETFYKKLVGCFNTFDTTPPKQEYRLI